MPSHIARRRNAYRQPDLRANYTAGNYPAHTISRASVAYMMSSGGIWSSVTSGQLRINGLGLWSEDSRSNFCLRSRDLTNAAWVKTNCTAALDQIGIDNTANACSSLTATGNNATCLQSITDGTSRARPFSAFIRRLVGTGGIDMTTDGGTTWTPVTPGLITTPIGLWDFNGGGGPDKTSRCTIPTQTLTNPVVGFRLRVNGDKIAIDCVQSEGVVAGANNYVPSSPILTTTAIVTRASEIITITTVPAFGGSPMSIYFEGISFIVPPLTANYIGLQISNGMNGTNAFALFKRTATNDFRSVSPAFQGQNATQQNWPAGIIARGAASLGTQGRLETNIGSGNFVLANQTNPPVATYARIGVGNQFNGLAQFNGIIRDWGLWFTLSMGREQLRTIARAGLGNYVDTGIYVDSVAGNDSGGGTRALPYKTLGKIPWANNAKVYLKRGSLFREAIDQSSGVTGATVADYGSGKMPVIDCTDIIPNTGWTQPDAAGAPNVWAKTITTPAILAQNFVSIWENAARLIFVQSRATCNSVPGTFTVTGSATGWYGPTSVTLEINVGGNPNTNGKTYEVPTRPSGISTGIGWTVTNIRTKRNGNNNGSLILNRNSIANGCIAEDGVKHNMLVGAGSVINGSYAWKGDYPTPGRDGWAGMVAFDLSLPAGSSVTFNNCFSIVDQATLQWQIDNGGNGLGGFLAHTDGSSQWSSINYNRCSTKFCEAGFAANDTVTVNVTAPHSSGCRIGVQLHSNATITNPWMETTDGINMIRQLDISGDATVTYNVVGARLYAAGNANDGMIYCSGDCTLNLSYSSLASLGHAGYHFNINKIGKNLNMTHVVNVCDYSGFGDGFSASDTPLALDYNAYSGMDMHYLGVQYAGYPAYFPLVQPGLEAHSIGLTGDQATMFVDAPHGNFTLTTGSGLDPSVFGVANPGLTYPVIPTPTDMGDM